MSTLAPRLTRDINAMQRTSWKQRAPGIGLALVLNAVILAVARLVNGEYPRATAGGGEQVISFVPVVLTTLAAGLGAWGLMALLERTTSRARTTWTILAVLVLLLSMAGPLGSGADTASRMALAALHIGAAAGIIPLMRRRAG